MTGLGVQVILGLLILLGTFVTVMVTRNGTIHARKMENEAAPYAAIAARVVQLEDDAKDQAKQMVVLIAQVRCLEEGQWEDRAYIKRLLDVVPRDKPLPTPMPAWLEMFGVRSDQPIPDPGA